MSSDLTWKRDANGVEHPTPETLLAFNREQCSEHEKSRVDDHLLAGCAPCKRLHADLKQSSYPLNHLKHMSSYLYYPELRSNQILLHMQRGEHLTSVWTGKRKRKFQAQSRPAGRSQATGRYARKAGLRYISIPAAFAVLILCMIIVVTLVYALASLGKLPFISPGQQSGNIYNNPGPNTPVVAPHQQTPTITPSVDAPTVTVTLAQGPVINYCQPSDVPHGYSDRFISICGKGFKAGDKVSLLLDYYGRNAPVTWGSYKVNNLGEFTGFLYFYSCKNLPIGVYARDEIVKPAVASNILTNITVAGCSGPTSTPTLRGR